MNFQFRWLITLVSFTIGSLACVLLIGGAIAPECLAAQTITVRMLNGKSGRPLSNKNVTLVWSPDFSPLGTVVHLGKDGTGTAEIRGDAELFRMIPGPKAGKEPDRIPYIDCNEPMMERVQISQVLKTGFVPGNACGKKSAIPRPGEIVFWAMPKPWWQPDMQ